MPLDEPLTNPESSEQIAVQLQVSINRALRTDEVPSLRERVGWSRRDEDYPLLFERCQFWAACHEAGVLIAFGYMSGMGLEHGYIEDIAVDPAHRRRGLGKAIVVALLAEARRRGTAIVTVTFDAENLKFYEACGFEIGYGGVWVSK